MNSRRDIYDKYLEKNLCLSWDFNHRSPVLHTGALLTETLIPMQSQISLSLSFYLLYNKENLERRETNKNGRGTEWHGTYLRLTRESSGPWVSVAKTYRDERKW